MSREKHNLQPLNEINISQETLNQIMTKLNSQLSRACAETIQHLLKEFDELTMLQKIQKRFGASFQQDLRGKFSKAFSDVVDAMFHGDAQKIIDKIEPLWTQTLEQSIDTNVQQVLDRLRMVSVQCFFDAIEEKKNDEVLMILKEVPAMSIVTSEITASNIFHACFNYDRPNVELFKILTSDNFSTEYPNVKLPDINSPNNFCITAFMSACSIDKEIAINLLEKGALFEVKAEKSHSNVLMTSAMNIAMLEFLFSDEFSKTYPKIAECFPDWLNTSNSGGISPLLVACKSDKVDCLKFIIKNGASLVIPVKEVDVDSFNIVEFCCLVDSPDVLNYLLGKEGFVKDFPELTLPDFSNGSDDSKLLMLASLAGHFKCLKVLLKNGYKLSDNEYLIANQHEKCREWFQSNEFKDLCPQFSKVDPKTFPVKVLFSSLVKTYRPNFLKNVLKEAKNVFGLKVSDGAVTKSMYQSAVQSGSNIWKLYQYLTADNRQCYMPINPGLIKKEQMQNFGIPKYLMDSGFVPVFDEQNVTQIMTMIVPGAIDECKALGFIISPEELVNATNSYVNQMMPMYEKCKEYTPIDSDKDLELFRQYITEKQNDRSMGDSALEAFHYVIQDLIDDIEERFKKEAAIKYLNEFIVFSDREDKSQAATKAFFRSTESGFVFWQLYQIITEDPRSIQLPIANQLMLGEGAYVPFVRANNPTKDIGREIHESYFLKMKTAISHCYENEEEGIEPGAIRDMTRDYINYRIQQMKPEKTIIPVGATDGKVFEEGRRRRSSSQSDVSADLFNSDNNNNDINRPHL